jgi:hypothetical protein
MHFAGILPPNKPSKAVTNTAIHFNRSNKQQLNYEASTPAEQLARHLPTYLTVFQIDTVSESGIKGFL